MEQNSQPDCYGKLIDALEKIDDIANGVVDRDETAYVSLIKCGKLSRSALMEFKEAITVGKDADTKPILR